MDMQSMGINEWLLIFGTVAGPVIAVQAQKFVERSQTATRRREEVFERLMATRQAKLSPDHVQALNSIDLAFYGRRVLGRVYRSKKAQAVMDAWNTYRLHLSPRPEDRPNDEAGHAAWNAANRELFLNLLEKLAVANKFEFERSNLQSGSYSPEAHGQLEQDQNEFRTQVLRLLRGEIALPTRTVGGAVDAEFFRQQAATQERIAAGIEAMAARGGS